MGQRIMQCFSQTMGLGIDPQDQGHAHPNPCFPLGSIPNISPHNFPEPVILPGSGNTPSTYHLQDHCENATFYGPMQYNGPPPHFPSASMNIGVATSSNFYNPYLNPSSGGVVPALLNHGFSDQSPSSSNQEVIGITDEYGRTNPFMDGARGSCKRKNVEGIPSNYQYFNVSASSSSSTAPLNTMQFGSGAPVGDATPFPLPHFGGTSSTLEIEPQRSMRNSRPGTVALKPVLAHSHNHLGQEIYRSQPFQPVGSPWLDQQPSSSSDDGGTSIWNGAPALPYTHGSTVNRGSFESRRQGIQGYTERTCNRIANFAQPSPIPHQHHSLQNSVSHIQGVTSQNIAFYPAYGLAPNNSSRSGIDLYPTHGLATSNFSHSGVGPQDSTDASANYSGPIPRNGQRIYCPRRGVLPESTPRNHNASHLRYLRADEVAILEIPGIYEASNFIDQHRDMRLDIDDMSYEELLALGERIGNVKTGLSEGTILRYLSTRTLASSVTCVDMEEVGHVDGKNNFCVICQADYKNKEKIGTLDCGHEYHANCLKKWLIVKNVCPVCKSPALNIEKKGI